MKVWINHRIGGYSGGIILVAANSAKEAHETFHEWDWEQTFWSKYGDLESDYYYYPNEWSELPDVVANVDKPQVLAEGGYTE